MDWRSLYWIKSTIESGSIVMSNLKKCTPFGMKVKIALLQKNMTNQELAQKLGYANSTISDVIFGRNSSKKTKALIAKALGIEDEIE